MDSISTLNRILAIPKSEWKFGPYAYFLDELSKEFGPKSGTGRILMVDGEPQTLNKESGPLLDYYVVQAYYCRSDGDIVMLWMVVLTDY